MRYHITIDTKVRWEIELEGYDEVDAHNQAVYEIEHSVVEWDKMLSMKLVEIREVEDAKNNQ